MEATQPHYIVINNLSKHFEANGRSLTAVMDVNLTVNTGEFVSIIGPSGCGKTTLLKMIGGLVMPTTGRVLLGEESPRMAQQRKSVGFVFQDASLLPWRTVEKNVLLPFQVNKKADIDNQEKVRDLINTVGLGQFAGYYPHQLSGGMKQRVALARALVFDPPLLLMDEPLGSLDEITREAMRYELLQLWETTKKTVLMVTHSIAEAVALSDRVVVMSGLPGRITDIIDIDIVRPRSDRIERSDAFLNYVALIKSSLAAGGHFEEGIPELSARS